MNSDLLKHRRFSVAPMMDWTDRHYRYFARLLTRYSTLYTEMIPAGAIVYGKKDQFLLWKSPYNKQDHQGPVAIQLGGANTGELAKAAEAAESYGYSEVNLNCGCPSDRVSSGSFGACLMAEPERVAEMVSEMKKSTALPVTVKHRIGIDRLNSYDDLYKFVDTVASAGCVFFTVHARIAILGGLSPQENRTIPPLRYEDVYRLKADFPELSIEINGGIRSIEAIHTHLKSVDSVMVGREAYENPSILAQVDSEIFDYKHGYSRYDILQKMIPYIDTEREQGVSVHHIVRHILGLMKGIPGARKFRNILSDASKRKLSTEDLFNEAIAQCDSDQLHVPISLQEQAIL